MEEHCGFVSVKNDVGSGAGFFLYFPFQSEEQDKMTPCRECSFYKSVNNCLPLRNK